MSTEEKPVVSKEETSDRLDIRIGRVISVEEESFAPKKAYKLKVDFGKFDMKTSVERFIQHAAKEIKNSYFYYALSPKGHRKTTKGSINTSVGLFSTLQKVV